jgi:hypothetical protein
MAIHPISQDILNNQFMACPSCKFTGGHAANCITNLQTPEQRVRRAAHLFHCYYPNAAVAHAREENLSDAEIESGRKLARVQKEHSAYIRSVYGDPAYGSYTLRPDDVERGRKAEQAVIDEHLAQLPQAEDERKPNLFEQLTLDEQLVASLAVAFYRKGKVA